MNTVNVPHPEPERAPSVLDTVPEEAPASDSRSGSAQPTSSASAPVDGAQPELPPEADRPRTGVIGVAIVATVAVLGAIVLGVNELFQQIITDEVRVKVLARPSSELRELRAQEEQKLNRYQWVSQKDGIVRIPLSRAQELTLADYGAARVDPAPTK